MSEPTPTPVPDFATRDPNSPAFWDERFERKFTPWDQAGVPSAFEAFASRHTGAAVLIPGCGSAYEALWLAEHGSPVRAIDFSPAAVVAAHEQLGAQHAALVEQADFFSYEPPFEPAWIYERAFLCALPLARRADYARRMAELLPPGAFLAGFLFSRYDAERAAVRHRTHGTGGAAHAVFRADRRRSRERFDPRVRWARALDELASAWLKARRAAAQAVAVLDSNAAVPI